MIGVYGEQLFSWFNNYIFFIESQFGDFVYVVCIFFVFMDELLCNGMIMVLVFGMVYFVLVNVFFSEVQ